MPHEPIRVAPPAVTVKGILSALWGAALYGVALVTGIALIAGIAHFLGLDFEAFLLLLIGVGMAVLCGLTLFQAHRQGPSAPAGVTGPITFYLIISTLFIGLGVLRLRGLPMGRAECRRNLAHASDSHERMDVLRSSPDVIIPSFLGASEANTCEQLLAAARR